MAFDYCFHDRQAQTAAAGGARHIRFVEPVENQRHVFWRNSGTVVADRESNMATGLFGRQRDVAAIRCVAKRIRGEILQRLFKSIGVARHPRRGIDTGHQPHVALGELTVVAFRHALE